MRASAPPTCGGGPDRLLIEASHPGAAYDRDYYTHDGLDSITDSYSVDGTHRQTLAYDAFGNKTATNLTTAVDPLFGYTGEPDAQLGEEIALRARDYDPLLGRFTSRDPVVPDDQSGATSLYLYVYNQPTVLTDPSGLCPPQVCAFEHWVKGQVDHAVEPVKRKAADAYNSVKGPLHIGLDLVGLVPMLGDFTADATNVALYALENDWDNAAFSCAAMIPIAGIGAIAAKGAKTANAGEKLLWTSWRNYPKVMQGGREYAQIGNRLYTKHAVDRMQPSGLGVPVGATGPGRSISPDRIEDVLRSKKGTPVKGPNGEPRLSYTSGTFQVITENDIVITVITR